MTTKIKLLAFFLVILGFVAHLTLQLRQILTTLTLGPSQLVVDVANNDVKIAMGMMFKHSFGETEGMLFVFEEVEKQSFWMKYTYLPLSIAFMDESGQVLEILDMNVGEDTIWQSSQPAKYALEVSQGWFIKNNVKVGDRMLIPASSSSP